MATFADNENYTRYKSWDDLESKHKKEERELEGSIRASLKKAKKAEKKELEAKAIQQQYDLKARHREEERLLEEYLEEHGTGGGESGDEEDTLERERAQQRAAAEAEAAAAQKKEEEVRAAKILKAQKKKDKEKKKEAEREKIKAEIVENMGPNMRAMELEALNSQLKSDNLCVKEVPADGNCLYRSIADQVPGSKHTFVSLRKLAAEFMRDNKEDFAPFLDDQDDDFEAYCARVENADGEVVWGGQLEIRALSAALGVTMEIFDTQAPVLRMGEEYSKTQEGEEGPIRLTYHRHYYALGEHYNSVHPIPVEGDFVGITDNV